MVVMQLVGQGAFIVASLVLGWKLLALWSRTRETPELTIGLAFLVGGGLGYVAWFAAAFVTLAGGEVSVVHTILAVGLAFSCIGSVCNGVGVARIYRPAARWPLPFVGALALVMAGGWVHFAGSEPGADTHSFWVAMVACTPIYAWSAAEAAALAGTLHKRAGIGLADPIVVNRVRQWSLSSGAVVLMIVLSFGSRLMYGPQLPAWVSLLSAVLGLVAATAIWLGFFPPAALRARLARSTAG